jgi:hypothetical protein
MRDGERVVVLEKNQDMLQFYKHAARKRVHVTEDQCVCRPDGLYRPSHKMIVRKELKEKFLRDLTVSEKVFFLGMARKAIGQKGYRASEDLFHYCYFHTMKERMRAIVPVRDEGYLRLLLVEGTKDIQETLKMFEERLEKTKSPSPDAKGIEFIEYFSE